jgi:hypothetical protein
VLERAAAEQYILAGEVSGEHPDEGGGSDDNVLVRGEEGAGLRRPTHSGEREREREREREGEREGERGGDYVLVLKT